MMKLILTSLSAIALLGLAACSDTDNTTTESIEQQERVPTQARPNVPTVPPGPQTGSGGDMPGTNPGNRVTEPVPASPAPAP